MHEALKSKSSKNKHKSKLKKIKNSLSSNFFFPSLQGVCVGRGKYTQKKKHPKINTQHEARLTRKYLEKKYKNKKQYSKNSRLRKNTHESKAKSSRLTHDHLL